MTCKRVSRLMVGFFLISLSSFGADRFYVAPAGNDSWSGRLSAPNAQGTDGPWRTPEGARAGVRAFKHSQGDTLSQPLNVFFRQGTYHLQNTWELNAPDSGLSGRAITYQNFPGEEAVISGGEVLAGWEAEGHLWKVQVPGVQSGARWLTVLYANGELRQPARAPNKVGDRRDPDGDGFFNVQAVFEDRAETIGFAAGDVQTYTNPDDVHFFFPHAWEVSMHRIDQLDLANQEVTFKDIRSGGISDHPPFGLFDDRQRYAVYHAWEELDQPGEWWLDRNSGYLYYFPYPEEELGVTEIVAPRLETVLHVNAFAGNPLRHVYFEGLHFRHTQHLLGPDSGPSAVFGLDNIMAQKGMDALVSVAGFQEGGIRGCTFSEAGNFGILVQYDSNNITITENHFHDLGAGAIDIGRDFGSSGAVRVENNWVHDCGQFVPSTPAIRIGDSADNVVAHNHISRHPYTGIWVGWVVGYLASKASNNWIHHNHIQNIGGDLMSDMGGIYTLSISPGTLIEHNLIHDISVYEQGYGGWGIYLDEGSSDIHVQKNLVYRTDDAGFHLHYGRDNLIANNIFAWSREDQLQRTRIELFGQSMTFEKNIVLFNTDRYMAGAWNDLNFLFRNNLIYEVAEYPFVYPQLLDFPGWQLLGQDLGTLITDPLFADAARMDFTLPSQSPAITQLGIEAVDVSDVGMQTGSRLSEGPSTLALPPTPFPKAPEEVPYHFDFEAPWLDADWRTMSSGAAAVALSDAAAQSGAQALHFVDAAGTDNAAEPVAYLSPRYRFGEATLRFWMRLSNSARFAMEWRESQTGAVGPNFFVDGSNLRVNGTTLASFPRNEWVQMEITTGLGGDSDGRFDLRLYRESTGWQTFSNRNYRNGGFRRLDIINFFNEATTNADVFLDDVELFTEHAIYTEPEPKAPAPAWAEVVAPNVIDIHFTETMAPGAGPNDAGNPANFAISGMGQGTLNGQPDSATVAGNTVTLQWDENKMSGAGILAVAIGVEVRSAAGMKVVRERVVLTENSGQFEAARPVVEAIEDGVTNANPLAFSVNYGEPVANLGGASLEVEGGDIAEINPSGTAASFVVAVTPENGTTGSVSLTVLGAGCIDAAGNPCHPGPDAALIDYDYGAPVASLSTAAPPLSNQSPIVFTLSFNELVAGLAAADLAASDAVVSNITPQGPSNVYTVSLQPTTTGPIELQLLSNRVTDLAGNVSAGAGPIQVNYDGTAPSVQSFYPTENGPVNADAMNWTIEFSERISGFQAEQLHLVGATGEIGSIVDLTGASWRFRIAVTAIAGDGPVGLRLTPSGAIRDLAGNTMTGVAESSPIIIDTEAPDIVIAPLSPKTFSCGDEILPPLVLASDALDGDVSDLVEVIGLLPEGLAAPGAYPVTYRVADQAGNEAAVEWIIEVIDNCPLTVLAEGDSFEKQAGESQRFGVDVLGAIGSTSYQWYRLTDTKGLSLIAGANSSSFYLSQISRRDAGEYVCQVSDAVTTRVSPSMELNVLGSLPGPSVFTLGLLVALLGLFGAARRAP